LLVEKIDKVSRMLRLRWRSNVLNLLRLIQGSAMFANSKEKGGQDGRGTEPAIQSRPAH
jgi:hypothetical protein